MNRTERNKYRADVEVQRPTKVIRESYKLPKKSKKFLKVGG